MARALRVQYEGAVYHVTCRGNERREIFTDELDRKAFLDLLKDSLNAYKDKGNGWNLFNGKRELSSRI